MERNAMSTRLKGEMSTAKWYTTPKDVRVRNADLTLVRKKIGWQPKVSLEEGLGKTYEWIEQKVNEDRKTATYPA